MFSYYIYDNHHRNRGRIHKADCPHCNYGNGKGAGSSGAYDRWLGFVSREAAYAQATTLGRLDMKPCSHCCAK